MNINYNGDNRLSRMSDLKDYDSMTPVMGSGHQNMGQHPFKEVSKSPSKIPKVSGDSSDMSSCESNEFSNMDEKINLGLQ